MSRDLSDFAQPMGWIGSILSICSMICIVVYICVSRTTEVRSNYIKQGYVEFTMRYPATYSARTIWIKEENVEKYAKLNAGIQDMAWEIENIK